MVDQQIGEFKTIRYQIKFGDYWQFAIVKGERDSKSLSPIYGWGFSNAAQSNEKWLLSDLLNLGRSA